MGSGRPPPFGYQKVRTEDDMYLVIDEEQAAVVRYIYDAFIKGTPIYLIREHAIKLGFPLKSKFAIHRILTNPLFYGYQWVKPWKNNEGGLYPLKNFEPIVDAITWNIVKEKMNHENKPRISISDDIPLRGVLRCHCGKLLTGAPSRGKMGKYYYYYKCQTASAHNNISAIKAHGQLIEALKWMSLPGSMISAIKMESERIMETKTRETKKLLEQKRKELVQTESQLRSIEEKWINNQITHDTYSRWHGDLTQKVAYLAPLSMI